MRVCTWNLWFDEQDQARRISLAMAEIMNTQADIVCLQEVTHTMLGYIQQSSITKNYIPIQDTQAGSYGCMFLLHKKHEMERIRFHSKPFPQTNMNRRMCILEIKGVTYITSHLESEFARNSRKPIIKYGQYEYLLRYAKTTGDCVVCGDFNVSKEDESVFLDILKRHGFGDASKETITYNAGVNTNIKDNYIAALDRILINFECKISHPKLIGKNAPFPSDHFGLVLYFEH